MALNKLGEQPDAGGVTDAVAEPDVATGQPS